MFLQVEAEDVDSHMNGAILYSIISGDQDNQFSIEPESGVIKVKKQLDRETVRTRTQKQTHANPVFFPFLCFEVQELTPLYKNMIVTYPFKLNTLITHVRSVYVNLQSSTITLCKMYTVQKAFKIDNVTGRFLKGNMKMNMTKR